jgi:hypothetical protein
MARFYGSKSEYLTHQEQRHRKTVSSWIFFVILAVGLTFYICIKALDLSDPTASAMISLVAAGIAGLSAYRLTSSKMERAEKVANQFHKGRKGEYSIYDKLLPLGENFFVFEDVRMPRMGNIDFIVLGPTGIYTLEVKSHQGRIGYRNGQLTRDGYLFEKDIMRQARGEAAAVSQYLEEKFNHNYFVKAVLVFSNPQAKIPVEFRNPIDNVFVCPAHGLVHFLMDRPPVFTETVMSDIEAVLKKFVVAAV